MNCISRSKTIYFILRVSQSKVHVLQIRRSLIRRLTVLQRRIQPTQILKMNTILYKRRLHLVILQTKTNRNFLQSLRCMLNSFKNCFQMRIPHITCRKPKRIIKSARFYFLPPVLDLICILNII